MYEKQKVPQWCRTFCLMYVLAVIIWLTPMSSLVWTFTGKQPFACQLFNCSINRWTVFLQRSCHFVVCYAIVVFYELQNRPFSCIYGWFCAYSCIYSCIFILFLCNIPIVGSIDDEATIPQFVLLSKQSFEQLLWHAGCHCFVGKFARVEVVAGV